MSHYKPYPSYKDSGVEWLGQVPAHWSLEKLKYIAKFSGGGTPSRENVNYWDGDIPWVSPKDMKSEKIYGAEESISIDGLRNSTTSLVAPDHILIVVRSGILKHTIPVAINEVEVALNQDMKAVRLDSQVCSSQFFLRWIQGFNDDLLQAWLKQGATVESIEQEFLAGTIVPVPPLIEQRAIVNHLDRETARIDGLVSKKTRFIQLLREKRQALITHAVTKGLDANAPMKDSGVEWLGDVPAHWSVCRLSFFVRLNPHEKPGLALNDEVSFLPMEAIGTDGVINLDRTRPVAEVRAGYSYFEDGDIAFAKVTPCFENGKGAIMQNLVNGLGFGTTELTVLRPGINANVEFLSYVIQSDRFRSFGAGAMTGAGGLKRVPDEFTRNFKVPWPDLAEQYAIAKYLNGVLNRVSMLISATESSIDSLKERRSALITAAVTGQIDLREAA